MLPREIIPPRKFTRISVRPIDNSLDVSVLLLLLLLLLALLPFLPPPFDPARVTRRINVARSRVVDPQGTKEGWKFSGDNARGRARGGGTIDKIRVGNNYPPSRARSVDQNTRAFRSGLN